MGWTNARRNDATVQQTLTYENLTINVIDHVLTIPQNFSATVIADSQMLSVLGAALRETVVPVFNASANATVNGTLFDVLEMDTRGFTLFAPNASQLEAALDKLGALVTNESTRAAVYGNFVRPFFASPCFPHSS